jgi:translation initiation factor IF-2
MKPLLKSNGYVNESMVMPPKVTQQMSSTTVAEFANELKKSTDTLLEQLKSAGVAKSAASDVLTDADKHSLLSFLQPATARRAPIARRSPGQESDHEIKQADARARRAPFR